MNILIVGSGAREHAIAKAFQRSAHHPSIFCFGSSRNPGIMSITSGYQAGSVTDVPAIVAFAKQHAIDWAFVGPEAPLEAGVVDALEDGGIPSVGPNKKLAQIETSKSFTRELLTKYNVPGMPRFQSFNSTDGLGVFINSLSMGCVVKADGLMGGKGVKVSGDHFTTIDQAVAYAAECIKHDGRVLIEEKLVGQEFSFMSLCDGENLVHFPPVQDHKRAFNGDMGPNTGGMGSYSDANHSLPFLNHQDIDQARKINEVTAAALKQEFGIGYKGVLYGGFMATADGVKLIEYNARFGDPECMNVLAILESDFVDVCQAVIRGTLSQITFTCLAKATVCKYAVPEGYPDEPIKHQAIDISMIQNPEHLYLGAVDQQDDGTIIETGSRTVAIVGVADTLVEAEQIAEEEIRRIKGPLFHRDDIGTTECIAQRVVAMDTLRDDR